jgi:hypothetical protein
MMLYSFTIANSTLSAITHPPVSSSATALGQRETQDEGVLAANISENDEV